MKVLALLTDGFGSSGGIAQYNMDLLRALSQSPSVSGVVALPRYSDKYAKVPEGVCQLAPVSSAYVWAMTAVSLMFRRGVDAIFCGHMNAAPFASFLSRLTGKPLWVQAHGIEAWEDRGPIFRWALSRADLVTAVSRHTRRKLLSWSDLSPDRVRVLSNTYDVSFSDAPVNDDLARRLGLEGKKVILTVGRLSSSERYKGHDRIIRCLPTLKSQNRNVVYLIVGTGDDQDRLDALARELNVQDDVIFVGHASKGELNDYYALADVFAMPSTGEGFGIVFLEAAAAGMPVIGGDCDGSQDALADGEIGRSIEPNDIDALAASIRVAFRQGRENRSTNLTRFDFKNYSNHVNSLVEKAWG